MSFIRHAFRTMNPIAQLVMLTCIVLTFMAVAAFVGLIWVTGGTLSDMQALTQASQTGMLDRAAMLAMNNANQLLAFLGASLAFAGLVGSSFLGRFFLHRPAWMMVGLAAVMALGMSPVLDFTYRLNEWALVPGSSLHEWAGALEAQAAAMTETLLRIGSVGDLMAVLVAVAVLPALCEEWLFRGTVQPVLMRGTGNLHLSVWVSAALFSAIHMQFFGFVPRMLLGALFGYLVAYSGSLWPAIVGHFVNNAGVVIAAWWMGESWLEHGLEPQPLSSWTWTDWGLAVVALVALVWAWSKMTSSGNTDGYVERLSPLDETHGQRPLQS